MNKRNLLNLVVWGTFACLPWQANAQNGAESGIGPVEVSADVQHDVSPPLGHIPNTARSAAAAGKPFRLIKRGQTSHQNDPVVQTSASAFVAATAGLSFAGVGNGDYGFAPNAAPPDTNGAVGDTQYVQWVNESFAVFDKATGAIAPGFPKAGNTLWSGFGGGCQTNNDGDPVVAFDKAAHRWILTQFSVPNGGPYLQCVAVSTTSDATGSYARYAFSQPNFNDYPKIGVWPDGYYISFNMFTNFFVGGRACAFDRANMLAGNPATQVCFQLNANFGGLLPSDLDGSTPPPAGAPNVFVSLGNNSASLDLWKFHVDFATPGNSTFTNVNISAPPFVLPCGGTGGTCVPQSGVSQQLDTLGDRLMHRLAYRNFGDHEALVVDHSVTAGSTIGVRWYEIRSPSASPAVFQSGTYAPDSTYRWMGSAAMDKVGNIAVGYSASSSSLHPSIRYTGRAPGDPPGTLMSETIILSGGGSQSGSNLSRWGDYSAMTIDPTDDCTFFYTNEYEKSTGAFNWSTWIASFKFPSCGGSPDFSLSANPASLTLTQGNAGGSTITVTSLAGFNSAVALTVASGCPAFTTCVLNPTPVTPPANGSINSTLTVTTNVGGTTPTGTTTLTISGNAGAHTTTVSLTVNPAPVPDFSLSANPTSLTLTQGNAGGSTITVHSVNGFSSSVGLTVTLGCPAFTTCVLNPTPVTPPANGSINSTLTVTTNVGGTTPTGTVTLTISGNAGVHTTTVSLTVNPVPIPDFSITASPSSVRVRRGGTAAYMVTITSSGGFSGVVSFGASGLPGGSTPTFNPTSVTGSGTATLSLKTASTTPTGNVTVTIKGTSGSLTHTTTVTLNVTKH